ncbi:hypothetical protein LMH87_010949 [Akanthomyces muscarius]|uniref:Uncharacterized protein n=1 Tax=Akanthomyces muscarius TaxID=2231603 RepID=A0A9W8UJH7_AKAMU|nr:hypothetical protein LMH87_010949 [Akanthomyces muscarius]KAJ4150187.1 hypothetical protein LMH87_010949 [Akanthomyces muscarius]
MPFFSLLMASVSSCASIINIFWKLMLMVLGGIGSGLLRVIARFRRHSRHAAQREQDTAIILTTLHDLDQKHNDLNRKQNGLDKKHHALDEKHRELFCQHRLLRTQYKDQQDWNGTAGSDISELKTLVRAINQHLRSMVEDRPVAWGTQIQNTRWARWDASSMRPR